MVKHRRDDVAFTLIFSLLCLVIITGKGSWTFLVFSVVTLTSTRESWAGSSLSPSMPLFERKLWVLVQRYSSLPVHPRGLQTDSLRMDRWVETAKNLSRIQLSVYVCAAGHISQTILTWMRVQHTFACACCCWIINSHQATTSHPWAAFHLNFKADSILAPSRGNKHPACAMRDNRDISFILIAYGPDI